MELLITLLIAIVLIRIIIKASSFFIRLFVFGLLIFGIWYFKYDILDQLNQLSQMFHLENWFSGFFNFIEKIGQNFIEWLNQWI